MSIGMYCGVPPNCDRCGAEMMAKFRIDLPDGQQALCEECVVKLMVRGLEAANKVSLKAAILKVLADKQPRTIKELIQEVTASGYKTKAIRMDNLLAGQLVRLLNEDLITCVEGRFRLR